VNGLPRWRIAVAILILAILGFFAVLFSPIYFHNLQLQNFVAGLTQTAAGQTQSDDAVRAQVLDKARQLNLPVTADNVHVYHSQNGLRIDVRYVVRVSAPGYTVDLHFYPGAGSR